MKGLKLSNKPIACIFGVYSCPPSAAELRTNCFVRARIGHCQRSSASVPSQLLHLSWVLVPLLFLWLHCGADQSCLFCSSLGNCALQDAFCKLRSAAVGVVRSKITVD